MLIKKGDRSLDVKHLQQKLNLVEDGVFGKNTEKAVIRYLLKMNMPFYIIQQGGIIHIRL